MPTLKDIDRVFECEVNTVISPPFPTMVVGATPLCSIAVSTRRAGYIIRAVVNWSATFTPIGSVLPLTTPGFAQVQFELLANGGPVARVTETIGQVGFTIGEPFTIASSAFDTTAIQVLDTQFLAGAPNPISIFEVRVGNVILVPPANVVGTVVTPVGTTTAAIGLVSLIVEEVDACRAQSLNV